MEEALAALDPQLAGIVFGEHLPPDGEPVRSVLRVKRRGKQSKSEGDRAAGSIRHRRYS
jgi:hypothetical protein